MINVLVQTEGADVARKALDSIPGAAGKAMSRALNKAIDKAKTETVAETKSKYTVKDRELRATIKVMGASANRLQAVMYVSSSPLSIPELKAKQGGTLSTEIVRGAAKQWKHGFLAAMKGSKGGTHKGVFARKAEWEKPGKGLYAGKTKTRREGRGTSRSPVGSPIMRQAIKEKFTVSTPQMAGRAEIMSKVSGAMRSKFDTELDRQMAIELK